MLKKILYIIVVIAIIVILAIMWNNSKKEESIPVDQASQNDSSTAINQDIDSINVDSGIDADLNSMDADIKTL